MDELEALQDDKNPDYQSTFRILHPLTPYEQDRLRLLNSTEFDEFFKPSPDHVDYMVKVFFVKSKQYLEKYISDMKRLYREHKFPTIQRRIFFARAKICLIVLFANDFTGALEAFQELLADNPLEFSKMPDMYYGLGLVYLHFKQYRQAIEAFSKNLYCHPYGKVATEARVRLAMCYMQLEDYQRCLKLFHICLSDVDSSKFMSKFVIKYNTALSNENFDELDIAELEYKKLLVDMETHEKLHGKVEEEAKEEMRILTAACNRQIGWISYRRAYKDEKGREDHLKKAQERLMKANELDPDDGQTFYYLGRVYGEQMNIMNGTFHPPNYGNNREPQQAQVSDEAHEAFVNYRLSIDKREQNSDCWCSIGALYQKQSQPMDALQAFICAIELNPKLTSAWVDLGELYEKNCQYQDALDCFRNAMKNGPVAPVPIRARINFLEKELNMPIPTRPPNHVLTDTFNITIPSLKEAYNQPIPMELRTRQNLTYEDGLAQYDNALPLWQRFHTMHNDYKHETSWFVPDPKPMDELEVEVLDLLKANLSTLVPAEKTAYECLLVSELVFKNKIREFMVSEASCEMPRVTEDMIYHLRDHGSLLENARNYDFKFLPQCPVHYLPISFSLTSKIYVPMDITSEELHVMLNKKITQPTYNPIFEEFAHIPTAPQLPKKPIVTEEEIKAALEKNERHPLIQKTTVLTVDNRKEAQSVELQRYLDNSTITCIRGLTSCLKLDLSLFSTKAVVEIDPQQEIRVLTQYHLPPETNCDHAGNTTWECISTKSSASVFKYAQYQAECFKHTLKREAEKIKRSGGRGPSPKRMKLMASASSKSAPPPPKDLKLIKFGTRVKLHDDTKWGKQINELSKLPAFCRLIAGSNMLSHLGHQIVGMNTVQLHMKVPGARTTAHQEGNNVASVNINIGPGDCEWFAVPYEYTGKVEQLCEDKEIDFCKGSFWPIMDELLEAGIPVHRFTQKAGDMVYVTGGSLHWVQATGWCNNISWNVAPLNNRQLLISLQSYEYNRLRNVRSLLPMQMLCWQLAKNVKFTNLSIYNTCKGVLIRSLSYLQMVYDWLMSMKKTIKVHARNSGEHSHFCMTCYSEVFSILFVKEINSKYSVFCAYCARVQNMEDFIILQQIPFPDLVKIYDGMKYITPAAVNNQKMSFTA